MWDEIKDRDVIAGANIIMKSILSSCSDRNTIIVGGSWPAAMVAAAVYQQDPSIGAIDLKPDDIDVFHGSERGDFNMVPGGNTYVDDFRAPGE